MKSSLSWQCSTQMCNFLHTKFDFGILGTSFDIRSLMFHLHSRQKKQTSSSEMNLWIENYSQLTQSSRSCSQHPSSVSLKEVFICCCKRGKMRSRFQRCSDYKHFQGQSCKIRRLNLSASLSLSVCKENPREDSSKLSSGSCKWAASVNVISSENAFGKASLNSVSLTVSSNWWSLVWKDINLAHPSYGLNSSCFHFRTLLLFT